LGCYGIFTDALKKAFLSKNELNILVQSKAAMMKIELN
jgi:hypothetical protein